jgi:hypothetical protein
MRRKRCAKVLMSRSPHAAAESCTAAIRRAKQFRALPDFQFFSMSLPVCSYFAPSSLISFFISTTNKGTGSGQCFPRAGLPQWRSHRSTGILPVGRPGVSPLFASVSLSVLSAPAAPEPRRRRAIRGRLQKLRGSLASGALADKIRFLWLNTELRGCRETEWATM